MLTGFNWFRIGSNGEFFFNWVTNFRFLKSREYLDQLSNYKLLKKDPEL
jgi:hypothetical protein